VIPFRNGNKLYFRRHFKKLVVIGGSMWCHLIQHWVMEGLPLLEAAYDLILSDPELHVLVPAGGSEKLTRRVLPPSVHHRIVALNNSDAPWAIDTLYHADDVILPDFSFRGCYASPPGFLAGGRVLSTLRGDLTAVEPNLVLFLWRARVKGQGRALLNGRQCCVRRDVVETHPPTHPGDSRCT
jgi:hypothetical protein